MKEVYRAFPMLLCILLFTVGCDNSSTSYDPVNVEERIADNNDFAFALYHQLRDSGENLLISPHSISVAFALAFAGARGNTEQEMAELLCFQLPQEQFHPAMKELNDMLLSRGAGISPEAFRLSIVNSGWGREGAFFLQAYLNTLLVYYGIDLEYLDFASEPEESQQIINTWVEEQTEGRITELLKPGTITSDTYLVLANTVYFMVTWLLRFNEDYTWDDPFTLLEGSEILVPMMHGEETFDYAEGPGYRAVDLPYEGEEISMVAILPDSGQFLQFEESFDEEKLNEILQSLEPTWTYVEIPKFAFASEFDLIPVLREMGMTEAFSPGADFSGMDGTDDGAPWIDVVAHKTFISVDENGTEASAGTGIVLTLGVHDHFDANRPFIFLIHDRETGTILFMGRVLDPSGEFEELS